MTDEQLVGIVKHSRIAEAVVRRINQAPDLFQIGDVELRTIYDSREPVYYKGEEWPFELFINLPVSELGPIFKRVFQLENIGDLLLLSVAELGAIQGVGDLTVEEITTVLADLGWQLSTHRPGQGAFIECNLHKSTATRWIRWDFALERPLTSLAHIWSVVDRQIDISLLAKCGVSTMGDAMRLVGSSELAEKLKHELARSSAFSPQSITVLIDVQLRALRQLTHYFGDRANTLTE